MKKVNYQGFTLIELMITVVILAVLVGVAVPSFSTLIERNRIQAQASAVFSSLMLARSEAVKNNQKAVMCKSANGSVCTTDDNWEQGWLIYIDADADGTLDVGESVVHSQNALPAQITIRTGANYANKLTFNADGTVTQADSFRVCKGASADHARSISVVATGRPRRYEGLPAGKSCP